MSTSIGVAVATYNGEKYIRKQLESIISQTVKPNLIIVSDGNSSDNTVSICNQVLSGSGIEYSVLSSSTQLDVATNFEKAFINCECEYVFFSDQDDVWRENKIELVLKAMKNNDAILAFTNAEIVNESLDLCGTDLWSSVGYSQSKFVTKYCAGDYDFIHRLLQRNIVTGMTVCVHNSAYKMLVPFSKKSIHDIWISLVCANIGVVIGIDERCVLYRQHSNNAVGTSVTLKESFIHGKDYEKKLIKRMEMIRELKERIRSYMDDEVLELMINYEKHLRNRVNYINKKRSLLFPLYFIKQYRFFELNPLMIVIKDSIYRIAFKPRRQRDKNANN